MAANQIDKDGSFNEKTDWWYTISQKEKEAIEEGLCDIQEGRTHAHEDVMKQYDIYLFDE